MSFNLTVDIGEIGFSLTIDNGRRSGIDRRRLLSTVLTDERRSGKERRNALDQCSTKTQFNKDPQALK